MPRAWVNVVVAYLDCAGMSPGSADRTDEPVPTAQEPLGFGPNRGRNLRSSAPWHPYAHHIRELPRGLGRLVPDLGVAGDQAVLDYGCADVPYRDLFPSSCRYDPADLAGNADATLDLNPDGTVPGDDETYDAVLSTQVLEHVRDPASYLAECFRVLRPGGRMLLSTHGSFVYHPDPVDLWRWTNEGLRTEIEAQGFQVERIEGIIGPTANGIQLFQDSVYIRLRWRRLAQLFCLACQTLMRLADRLESDQNRQLNACVFGVVARKPA